jgi:hypothetical protein
MIKSTSLAVILGGSIALCVAPHANPVVGTTSDPIAVPIDLERTISWLPADTETITVARGPFVLASTSPGKNETQDHAVSDKEIAQNFEDLPLALLQFKNGLLAKRLEGKRITLALEGARHFRPPADLGEMPYEGCAVALFSDDLHNEIASFTKEARRAALQVEQIEDQEVLVFQEKLERDTWTTFVAFPNEHMVLLASDRSYLREVLARMRGNNGQRALPNDLPEWKYLDTTARFWGLRHYDKSQAQADPSSPFGGKKSANFPDQQAIGLTFLFDPQTGRSATMTYLSGDTSISTKPSSSPLGMARSPEANGLSIKYRELAPGIVQGSYSLEHSHAVQFFLFVLEGTLGHAIYL